MSSSKKLPGVRLAAAVGLAMGAVGIVVQRVAGVDMPAVPPGLVMLIVAAALVAFVRWRWVPALGAVVGLAEVLALAMTGSLADLVDISQSGVFVGTWVRTVGVVIALIAGVAATAAGYRSSVSAPSHS
jgi:hypothetical protein